MSRNHKFHRAIATFFLLIFFPTLIPQSLYANNNGPVAPEATSFEPVDAADMVNLSSGDMSYVMPLINIPSPEGGYPLSLSYHSGIAMDQEASWTGLGWTLNPGAINRSVTGVPDDWKRAKRRSIVFDAGGEIQSISVGVSVGLSKTSSVGIYGSFTENKTFGGTTSYSSDFGVFGSFAGVTGSLGTNGASLGITTSLGGGNLGAGIGVSKSFEDNSSSLGIGIGTDNSGHVGATGNLGISFSSKGGIGVNVASNGFLISGNSNSSGSISTSGFAASLSIQIYCVNLELGYGRTKYWVYENNFKNFNGSLYAGDMMKMFDQSNFQYQNSFDSYNSLYKFDKDSQSEGDCVSYVAYDNYSVSGQGISGVISPAILQVGSLLNTPINNNSNKKGINYTYGVNHKFNKDLDNSSNSIYFYFKNEPVSYYKNPTTGWSYGMSDNWGSNPIQQISCDILAYDPSGIDSVLSIDGQLVDFYNPVAKRKRTGKCIETFTNEQINNSNNKLIIQPRNYDRTTAPKSGIGAFRITALDGKVYHYSIPVYQKQQVSLITDNSADFSNRYIEEQQFDPFATHWLLTAVTGPDYVDTNNNNMVDEADLGYWVEFDYGKWTDGYRWSSQVKSNDKSKFYEWGIKELYYLDRIKTRTHSALFIKSERDDDIGLPLYQNESKENKSRTLVEGKDGNWYLDGIFDLIYLPVFTSPAYLVKKITYNKKISIAKSKSLKLEKIVLVKNADATITKNSISTNTSSLKGQINLSEDYNVWDTNGAEVLMTTRSYSDSWYGDFYNNIYDQNDLNDSKMETKSLKIIKFNYGYNLAQNSPTSEANSKGKLTLNSIEYLGRKGKSILPPYKFEYITNNNSINLQNYVATNEDAWGFYKDHPYAWSLKKIVTPTGANLNITYESDDIEKEAIPGTYRGFDSGLIFMINKDDNYLYLNLVNDGSLGNVDFRNFFKLGFVNLDLWASLSHGFRGDGVLSWMNCYWREADVSISSSVIPEVINVTPSLVQIKVAKSNTVLKNNHDGLNWLCGHSFGYNYSPDFLLNPKHEKGLQADSPCAGSTATPRVVLCYKLLANKTETEKKGGGVRVKEIGISEGNTIKSKLKYFYNKPGTNENPNDPNYVSSGITSFVPQRYFKEIKFINELPSPGVMYEYVTVKNFTGQDELVGGEEYNFIVLPQDKEINSEDLVLENILEIRKKQTTPAGYHNGYTLDYSYFEILNNTSMLGALKGKKVFNKNLQTLSLEKNTFKNILAGTHQESFSTYKKVSNIETKGVNYRLGVSTKISKVYVPASKTVFSNGFMSSISFDKYNYLTGEVLETSIKSADGKKFKTRIVPAYLKYPKMGSKVDDPNNRNMLSQTAAEYSYILDNGTWKETGVGITTWNNEWTYQDIEGNLSTPTADNEKIWRKHKTYTWNGLKDSNGIFQNYNSTNGSDDGFDWTIGVGSQPAQWKKTSEVTLYDHYSMLLEAKDVNNNHAATKMGDNETKITAVGNAKYNEIFYSGMENLNTNGWLEPSIKLNGASRNKALKHTGDYATEVTNTGKISIDLKASQHKAGKYKLNFWVHTNNAAKARVNCPGGTLTTGESKTAGDWVLKTYYLDIPATATQVELTSTDGTAVIYDDVMLRPIASGVTGYVYNQWDELAYIVSNNGLATHFEYDEAGRLWKTSIEVFDDQANSLIGGFKPTTENKMKYKYLK